MEKSRSQAYAQAGVDITAGYKGVELMKKDVSSTYSKEVLSQIGGFSALYMPNLKEYNEPVLVSGTDGVGTKIRIAQLLNKYDSIGIDAVAMCVNDIICSGAKPLFFLDYIAIGKNDPYKVADIVKGIAKGCREASCALIGGETAEHPGLMKEDDFDIAGFATGIVDKEKILGFDKVEEDDVIIALKSSGFHSNGYSLIRQVFDVENSDLNIKLPVINKTLGQALLEPTIIYVKPILNLLEKYEIHSIAHITGGGFLENIPRAVKDGLCAEIKKELIEVPYLFKLIQTKANITEHDMFNTFNMGVGMTVILKANDKDEVLKDLNTMGIEAYQIGSIIKGQDKIKIC